MDVSTVLVAGGYGQLGQELQLVAPEFGGLRFVFARHADLDITQPQSIERAMGAIAPRYVVNCAAYTAVDAAESDEPRAMLVNGRAPALLAEACVRHNAQLLHLSSDYVFDGMASSPYTEEAPAAPLSAYGRSKLEGERAAMGAGVALVLRTSWLYSPFGGNFVKTMLRLSANRPEIAVVADQLGSPTYAHDLAWAIASIVASGHFRPGLFHYANRGMCSWYDLAREVVRLASRQCRIRAITTEQYPTPAVRPRYSVLSTSKLRETFDLDIPHWADSLSHCLKRLGVGPTSVL